MALSEYCMSMLESGGHYLVHNLQKCDDLHLPAPENRAILGHYYTPQLALERAREFFKNVNVCPHCCGMRRQYGDQD